MLHQTFKFHYCKTDFHGEYWTAEKGKAVVIIVHGLGEHLGRFEYPRTKLVENNFDVIAFDHFGHGKTSGKRGHNPGYEKVLESIQIVVKKAKEIFGNQKPIFLYGHSMGGNAVINYMLQESRYLKGGIVTSPFLRLAFQPPKWKLFMGNLIRKIAPSITLGNEVDATSISREEEEVKKYRNDPLVHGKVSPNFSLVFMEKGEEAISKANTLNTPMLLLHGTGDRLIDYKGTIEFSDNSEMATLKLYKGGYHELHNDLCKEEMMEDIINWLSSQI